MDKKGVSTYRLREECGIDSKTVRRLRTNQNIEMKTLDRICAFLDCSNKRAEKLQKSDYEKYDFFICMDDRNMTNMLRIFGEDSKDKCKKLLDYTDRKGDVADPYWTGDFNETLYDIEEGIKKLYEFLERE